ncbi:CHCH domain protein, partial [Ostertagia ostertagi]
MSGAPSHWAKDSLEEDRVETLIRGTGCWDQHLAVVDCMGDKSDWRQCQEQVQQFKECMTKRKPQAEEKKMLSDLFANLEIDEAETNKERGRQCTPKDYLAEIHYVGWFLNRAPLSLDKADEDRDLISYKAAYFYHHRKYNEALDEYIALFSEYKHSRTHTVAVIDSLIPSFPVEEILSYLREYEQCALDYGDQLQYLSMKKDVYAVISLPDASQNFIDTVCLLCASVDLPEHWLAFGQRHSLECRQQLSYRLCNQGTFIIGTAFETCSRLRKPGCKQKDDGSTSLLQIEEARQKMGFDMVSHDEVVETSEEKSLPVHDIRSKIEVYKSAEECEIIIKRFKCKFSWMFEGCALR